MDKSFEDRFVIFKGDDEKFLEAEINTWIANEEPIDITRTEGSSFCDSGSWVTVITIWYQWYDRCLNCKKMRLDGKPNCPHCETPFDDAPEEEADERDKT